MTARRNPFELVKASDFSDEQIERYWVDLAGEAKLHDLFQPTLTMPMLLLGGKGSGKTHLMRFYSAPVRAIKSGGSLSEAVRNDKYLGIYVRADGLNVGRFSGKGVDEEAWAAIFSYYFELWLASHFVSNVRDALSPDAPFDEAGFVRSALDLFHTQITSGAQTLSDLASQLASIRKQIDHVVSNVATGRESVESIEITCAPGELVFGLPEVLGKATSQFQGTLFVYLIDEIENFTAAQQRFLNSLIRYRRGQITFKIGSRLYGIRTKRTLGGPEEEIRQGAEYERVELDAWLRSHDEQYSELAARLIISRLHQAGFAVEGKQAAGFFEELDGSDFYRICTGSLVERFDREERLRPYFEVFRRELKSVGADDLLIAKVIVNLTFDAYPLLEKTNLYIFYKDWKELSGSLALSERIQEEVALYSERGREAAPSYAQSFEHFKFDFLAQLFRECGKRRTPYAGLDTLIHLSQGAPRNLLGLLKHIFRRSHFAEEKPFEEGKISIGSQIDGIRDAAAWFWEDSQPDEHGPEARHAVQSLAELFSTVRFSPKPSECELSTFTISAGEGTAAAREVLKHAENWSYLVRVASGGVPKNDGSALSDKYQLSPMLAPRWEVSDHRRLPVCLRTQRHQRRQFPLDMERDPGRREPDLEHAVAIPRGCDCQSLATTRV